MPEITLTETLILSIVAEKPMHGYELNKIIEDRNVRKWADVGFSSVYYVLDKLELKEYLTSDEVTGKEKKIFCITNDGKIALKKESKYLISTRHPSYTHWMTGITSSLLSDNQSIRESLSLRLLTLSEDLELLRKKMKSSVMEDEQSRMLFDFSETMLKSEIKWIKGELKRS